MLGRRSTFIFRIFSGTSRAKFRTRFVHKLSTPRLAETESTGGPRAGFSDREEHAEKRTISNGQRIGSQQQNASNRPLFAGGRHRSRTPQRKSCGQLVRKPTGPVS